MGTDGLAGVIVIDARFALAAPPAPVPLPPLPPLPPEPFTVRLAEPENPPDCAEIVAVPEAIPVTIPGPLIPATLESDELHCAEGVRSCVVPSEYCPVALNDTLEETPTDAAFGETETPLNVAGPGEPPLFPLLGAGLLLQEASSERDANNKMAQARRTGVLQSD